MLLFFSVSLFSQAAADLELRPIRIEGMGLRNLPEHIRPLLHIRLFLCHDEHDVMTNSPPEKQFRVFSTNETSAVPLGNGGADLLDLTGDNCPWIEDNSVTLWIEGLVHGASAKLVSDVSLNGTVIARDSIRVKTAPFLALSNCDPAEKLFYSNESAVPWESFELDITNGVCGFIPAEASPHIPFPQDVAELGWSPEGGGHTSVWSMDRNGFKELLSSNVCVFFEPAVPKMGGNVEATPPTDCHTNGCLLVGRNLPPEVKEFLRAQEVQTDDGDLLEIPLDWLKVGHVDEVVSVLPIPGTNAFKILIGDLDLAVQELQTELSDVENLLLEDPSNDYELFRKTVLENLLAPYLDADNSDSVALVRSKLAETRQLLLSRLRLDTNALVSIPVLYPLLNVPETHPYDPSKTLPNMVNLVALRNGDGNCRILLPDPRIDRFLLYASNVLEDSGYVVGEVWTVDTELPHADFGEVHCASNVLRRRRP